MSLPVVAIFGKTGIELRSSGPDNSEETRELRCVCFATDAELEAILLRERPHVLVSFGKPEDFPRLLAAPFDVRRRWINFAPDIDRRGWARRLSLLSTQRHGTSLKPAAGQRLYPGLPHRRADPAAAALAA